MATKNAFILYHEYADLLSDLSNQEMGFFMRAIFEYERTGKVPALSPIMKMAFGFIQKDLDNNREKWEKESEKRREAGQKGGQAKASSAKQSQATLSLPKQKQAVLGSNKQSQANQTDNERENDHSCDNDHSCEREHDNMLSLSQQKFAAAFPNKAIDCEFDDSKFKIDWLIGHINESGFLKQCNNLGLWWCLEHYEKIIKGDYKTFTASSPPPDFKRHDYKPGELNHLYADIDKLEI